VASFSLALVERVLYEFRGVKVLRNKAGDLLRKSGALVLYNVHACGGHKATCEMLVSSESIKLGRLTSNAALYLIHDKAGIYGPNVLSRLFSL